MWSPPAPQSAGRRLTTAIALVPVLCACASAQSTVERPHALYLEILGNAGPYSVNYEHRLTGPVVFRIGAGYLELPETEGEAWSGLGMVPVMVGYVNPRRPHTFEVTAGVARVLTKGDWDDVGILSSETRIVGTAALAYRLAPLRNGFLFRAAFTPWFGAEGFTPWGGLSLGYRF